MAASQAPAVASLARSLLTEPLGKVESLVNWTGISHSIVWRHAVGDSADQDLPYLDASQADQPMDEEEELPERQVDIVLEEPNGELLAF